MTAPLILITLQLEADPKVSAVWLRDDEERRMRDWLDARPDLRALVDRALEISAERRAA